MRRQGLGRPGCAIGSKRGSAWAPAQEVLFRALAVLRLPRAVVLAAPVLPGQERSVPSTHIAWWGIPAQPRGTASWEGRPVSAMREAWPRRAPLVLAQDAGSSRPRALRRTRPHPAASNPSDPGIPLRAGPSGPALFRFLKR